MMKGVYCHKNTARLYEILDDDVLNKDNEERMVLYCERGNPTKWYVRNMDHFKKKFLFVPLTIEAK